MRHSMIILAGVVTVCGCMSLSNLEKSVLYQPIRVDPLQMPPGVPPPRKPGEFEEVRISLGETRTKTPGSLAGLYAEAKAPAAVVLYCHGNGGNVEYCVDPLQLFRDVLHCTVLAFDYRGYGASSDREITEAAIYADARLARAWLAQRAGVAERDIIIVGRSLGGGVAVELAAHDGARGLILENTFTSIPDVAVSHVLLPVHWIMDAKYDSLSKIGNYHGPLLQTHGEADRVVPYRLGKKLFAAANEPKQFVRIWNGDHNDPPDVEYVAALRGFIEEVGKR